MINENFALLGAAIFLFGSIGYLLETIQGKVKPNRVTWFLWALAPLVAFTAQIKQGVGIQSLLTLMAGLIPFVIFFASFINKNSYWKIGRLDIICGIFSILGLVLWWITKVGNVAIAFAILADLLAALPTIVKSYKEPETENYLLFLAIAISAVFTLFTIKIWNFATYGFPFYLLIVCTLLTLLIRFKIGKRNVFIKALKTF